MRRHFGVAFSLGIALLLLGSSKADTVIINISGTDGEQTWTDQVQVDVDDQGNFFAVGTSSTAAWDLDYLVTGDTDPVLTANFSGQNLLAVPVSILVNTFMPVAPVVPLSATSGSVAYTVTDGSLPQNGATVAALAGSSLYEAVVDGTTTVETLFDFPYTLVAAPGGSNSDNDDFGLPGQTFPGPAITTSMEINYEFSLTPNDLVSITGNFVALPIPEPSSFALCGLGLAAAALIVRRSVR